MKENKEISDILSVVIIAVLLMGNYYYNQENIKIQRSVSAYESTYDFLKK